MLYNSTILKMMANLISEFITDKSPQLKPKVHVKIEGTANDDKNRKGAEDDKRLIHRKEEMKKIR